ncbi:unnamed protein product [Amoebophrya sp. A25]|nr:unnamed protein product [Amoebophrya sp. A25]|eukprot:GSA25T00021361001.1
MSRSLTGCICLAALGLAVLYLNLRHGLELNGDRVRKKWLNYQHDLSPDRKLKMKHQRFSVTVMPVVDANFAGGNFVQLYSIQCYARKHGYRFEVLNTNAPEHKACNSRYGDFFFRKHCAVADVLKRRREKEAGAGDEADHFYFVIDSDMVVAGMSLPLTYWLQDNPADLTFYERSWNFEVMAGNYIVRNTPFATEFLDRWAKYYYRLPTGFSSSDQGAIHQLMLETLHLRGHQECRKEWKNLTAPVQNLKPYFHFVSCTKRLLGPPRDWKTRINVTRKRKIKKPAPVSKTPTATKGVVVSSPSSLSSQNGAAGVEAARGLSSSSSSSRSVATTSAPLTSTTSKPQNQTTAAPPPTTVAPPKEIEVTEISHTLMDGRIRILPRWHGFAADHGVLPTRCSAFHVFHHGVKGSQEAANLYNHVTFRISSTDLLKLLNPKDFGGTSKEPVKAYDFLTQNEHATEQKDADKKMEDLVSEKVTLKKKEEQHLLRLSKKNDFSSSTQSSILAGASLSSSPTSAPNPLACFEDKRKCPNKIGESRLSLSKSILEGENGIYAGLTTTSDFDKVYRWSIKECLLNFRCRPLGPDSSVMEKPFCGAGREPDYDGVGKKPQQDLPGEVDEMV